MATWGPISQHGGPFEWAMDGGGITNHEVFAFALQSAGENVGALLSDVTVFLNTSVFGAQTTYAMKLTAVDLALNETPATIVGSFESNGV